MEETPSEEKKSGSFWSRQLPLERETSVFILVNALDVFMTYLLLRTNQQPGGSNYIVESNQIANYFIAGWGIKGMVYFKFGLVAVVTVIAQIVFTKRPTTARLLLNLGSLVVAAVVIYSFMLYVREGHLG
ncbi:DUF5658 family protein [uncultured Gimesia sp.]|uniref:DUF5658 family protein n=1 Tax=uncultured Gimesia sp. TaxID=1678688 RepID=UPI00263362E7|nr:DUF5658 family protein [uncultured Gimesia sp.]